MKFFVFMIILIATLAISTEAQAFRPLRAAGRAALAPAKLVVRSVRRTRARRVERRAPASAAPTGCCPLK